MKTIELKDVLTSDGITTITSSYTTEYNISKLHPTKGVGGTNKFTLAGAIALIPEKDRFVGIKCSFINEANILEKREWQGGTWTNVDTWGPLEDENGVFVMFHRKSDDIPLMVKPSRWPDHQKGGEVAEGVVVVEGGRMLVVAPTETQLSWSSAPVSGGGTTTGDRITAFANWNGKADTAAQIKHSECNTNAHAPGYCNAYSRTNANGKGLTAGKWWLPSMGELMLMYANMTKINYALKLITGAEPLAEDWYWSSTEGSATNAWNLNLHRGYVSSWGVKATVRYKVRPVSEFIM